MMRRTLARDDKAGAAPTGKAKLARRSLTRQRTSSELTLFLVTAMTDDVAPSNN